MDEGKARLGGIALMIGAFIFFAGLDSCAKFLGASLPVAQTVFLRYVFAVGYALVFVWFSGGKSLFITKAPKLQIVRGLLLLAATLSNFVAVKYLRLDQTSAIMFSSPLWVCALSVPLLGEAVGPRRWIAVAFGFLGVLVIIRPGTDGFHWAMLLSLASTLSVAFYLIASRKVGAVDSSKTSVFYASVVGAVAAAPAAPFVWVPPDGFEWLLIVIMGLCGGIGHHMLSQAHRMAPAPVLAPFIYTQIVSMAAMGYLFFGDVPDAWTIAGASIVIGSGLYLLYRERRLQARPGKCLPR
ncbi:MAG: DMT family transporter [Hyphomicrobiales bacterium]